MHSGKDEMVKGKILATLARYDHGLTITELSAAAGVHRQTAAKYLLELIALGKVHRRIIGPVALHYPKRVPEIIWKRKALPMSPKPAGLGYKSKGD